MVHAFGLCCRVLRPSSVVLSGASMKLSDRLRQVAEATDAIAAAPAHPNDGHGTSTITPATIGSDAIAAATAAPVEETGQNRQSSDVAATPNLSMRERPPLFRLDVAERNWDMLAARGLKPRPPRHTGIIIAALIGLFATGFVLLTRHPLTQAEFAAGYLAPRGNVTRILAPRQGIVGTVLVREGQEIAHGTAIVTLRSAQTTESGDNAEHEIAVQIESQRRDLEAQIAREAVWRSNEEQRLKVLYDQLTRDIGFLEHSIELQREELLLAQRNAERIEDLVARGVATLEELQRRQMVVLDQRLALSRAEHDLASKRAELLLAGISIKQLPTVAAERLRGLREALANVQQRAIEIEARRAITIRTPVDGRIAALPDTVGANIDNSSLIATVVPEGAELYARLLVPSRAIGKVHAGQSVALRYEAFPYQKYGTFKGRIEAVSASALLPQEISRIAPLHPTEAAYVVDVRLDRQDVTLGPAQSVTLRPDMLLTATVEVDRRPLLAWIGESIFGVAQH